VARRSPSERFRVATGHATRRGSGRDRQEIQQESLRPCRQRTCTMLFVATSDDHQGDCAQALGPRRPAEEHPPQNDRTAAEDTPIKRIDQGVGTTTGTTN